jgi:phage gp46-like protein
MEMLIDTGTGDYTGGDTDTLANAVWLRIMTPLGSWWADPSLGSLLHTLRRQKDLARVATLARQYAAQALQPLLSDGRAEAVDVDSKWFHTGVLLLTVTVTQGGSVAHTWTYRVRVF